MCVPLISSLFYAPWFDPILIPRKNQNLQFCACVQWHCVNLVIREFMHAKCPQFFLVIIKGVDDDRFDPSGKIVNLRVRVLTLTDSTMCD